MFLINEFSLRKYVARLDLESFLSQALGVKPDRIIGSADFWKKYDESDEPLVGLDVQWSSSGFGTFLNWYQNFSSSYIDLLNLAASASRSFNTDVALGNFIDSPEVSTDQFFVVTPDAQLYRAHATENSDVFDVELDGPAVSIADTISAFGAGDQKRGRS